MVIKSEKIKLFFVELIEELISREKAQQEVIEIMHNYDVKNLEFYPAAYEDKIWDALQYIELYAEKVNNNTYLYSQKDLINYIKLNGWDDYK